MDKEQIRNEIEKEIVKTKRKRNVCQKKYFDLDEKVKQLTWQLEEMDKE